MTPNREAIYGSVFEFFAALPADGSHGDPLFLTATRKAAHWENVNAEQQPALLMEQVDEEAVYQRGLPVRWRLRIRLWLYVHTLAATASDTEDDAIPSQMMNPLLDAIEAALVVDDPANAAVTLGGRVSHCSIEGTVQYFEGNMGDTAVAIVPIVVVVPA